MKEQPPVPTAEQQKALAEYALTQDERYRKLLDLARGNESSAAWTAAFSVLPMLAAGVALNAPYLGIRLPTALVITIVVFTALLGAVENRHRRRVDAVMRVLEHHLNLARAAPLQGEPERPTRSAPA